MSTLPLKQQHKKKIHNLTTTTSILYAYVETLKVIYKITYKSYNWTWGKHRKIHLYMADGTKHIMF